MTRCFYEFFAGGGMVRAGLGPNWRCVFANDIDPRKAAVYRANWGDAQLQVGDVAALTPADLPGRADLAWASCPCQDLSLAGAGAGLNGARSGAFWPFWRLMRALAAEGRAPQTILLENVCGLLTSKGGQDFAGLGAALAAEGWRFGALVLDAKRWLPQSRPRLFVLAIPADAPIAPALLLDGPDPQAHPRALIAAHARLSPAAAEAWLWWRPPPPHPRVATLADVVEEAAAGWLDPARVERQIALMSDAHRAQLTQFLRSGERRVGALYRRMRRDAAGAKVQRAELRVDGLAGCLRTPAGGSSRQVLVVVDRGAVKMRLLTPREAARLMGLPDSYHLPTSATEAYHLLGDGVAAPVARALAAALVEPLTASARTRILSA